MATPYKMNGPSLYKNSPMMKKTSKKMQQKIDDAKRKNLRDTNALLIKQGKKPVKIIK